MRNLHAFRDRDLASIWGQRNGTSGAANDIYPVSAAGSFDIAVHDHVTGCRGGGEGAAISSKESGARRGISAIERSPMVFTGSIAKNDAR